MRLASPTSTLTQPAGVSAMTARTASDPNRERFIHAPLWKCRANEDALALDNGRERSARAIPIAEARLQLHAQQAFDVFHLLAGLHPQDARRFQRQIRSGEPVRWRPREIIRQPEQKSADEAA